ncbi:unnamed protein product [Phytophthora lilii]|uniref:Unnamed protein product n=1 Tax=Phytophthora lilii TaxID=2077276 RepID=A0A9W6TEN5_9STRA|nr:unnamed protein product [Phytophthora lilii]
MHEHFRKKLRAKTPMEQRDIMARASVRAGDWLLLVKWALIFVAVAGAYSRPTCAPRSTGRGREDWAAAVADCEFSAHDAGGFSCERGPNNSSDELTTTTAWNWRKNPAKTQTGVLTEVLTDPSKRACVQAFLKPSSATAHLVRSSSSTESVVSASNVGSETPTAILAQEDGGDDNDKERNDRSVQVEHATDTETDEIICCLQLETNQAMPDVVHALYYCSGDTEMAKAFLKGASPSGMWSQDDDLLLVNLVAEECIDRSAVDAAVARGDFAAMRVPRDTDAILDRVQYLR